jgi:thioester reductase-like protein
MKNYYMLTGATGLLGRYLIKDLTQAGLKIAVLVRPSRRQTAEDRVEAMMRYWDKELGYKLPRPVVLSGDICQEDLGLDPSGIKWAAENVSAMIHNAASLSFISTSKQGEPWKSNIGGTQNVVNFCESAQIREFHHVSTAYICGLREGVVKETELDVGQKMSNDYEISKVAAEKIVRESNTFDSLTVLRPAIIVGDYQTGFTTTFHGFYALTQLVQTLVRGYEPDATGLVFSENMRLNLSGDERKNLVPVDWVSAVMSHVISNPKHHGQTYHLTPQHPVTARQLLVSMEAATHTYGPKFVGSQEFEDRSELEQLFYDHFHVYSSYWRNDPTFDSTNTQNAAPHLPCPLLDLKKLIFMARVACEMNFQFRDEKIASQVAQPV